MKELIYPEFYPTPESIVSKMLSNIDFNKVATVLEPSAGKGDIAVAISKRLSAACYGEKIDDSIDCIEINPDLRAMLKGKGFHVVHDDFLTFHTHKQYDLIVMNPPFSNGDLHLLHALELVADGGGVVCLLNAETLRNPYTNTRKALVNKLTELGASIEYLEGAFSDAERETDVEIALVKAFVPEKEHTSFIFDKLKQKSYAECLPDEEMALITDDYIVEAVRQFNMEVEAGIKLIREYEAMKPYIMESLRKESYNKPTIEMSLHKSGSSYGYDLSVNHYVKLVRYKYWEALFQNPKFVGKLTSNIQEDLRDKLRELTAYDFSLYNIRELRMEVIAQTTRGIEETILALFDKFSAQYAWYPECADNIHYFNGWATNKAHCINKKVIIPENGYYAYYSLHAKELDTHKVFGILNDLEKTLDYLSGQSSDENTLQWLIRQHAENPKKIPLKYFNVTFYKKGTCHIEFTNLRLLERLNIFGSQRKGWLPPSYGKKQYADMSAEEQAVVDDFQGKEAYDRVMEDPKAYIIEPAQLLMLADGGASA